MGKYACELPPSGVPDAYHVEHSSPIERTIYRYRVPDDLVGQSLGFAVTAMDRSGNIGPWSPVVVINTNVKTQSTSPQATAYNNGRKLLYDKDGHLHLAYVSNDSVFYQKSWDDGYSWTPARGITSGGREPSVSLGLKGTLPVMAWSASLPRFPSPGYSEGFIIKAGRMADGAFVCRTLFERYGGLRLQYNCSPPSIMVNDSMVHLVFEESKDYRPVGWYWKVYYTSFPLSAIDGSAEPLNPALVVLDSAGGSGLPPHQLASASLCLDNRGGLHAAWDRDGEIWWRMYDPYASIWRNKVNLSNSPDIESLEPSLSFYGDVHLVWQEGNDIYHQKGNWGLAPRKDYPPAGDFWWFEPENVSNSPATPSLWPVYDGGYAAWSEEINEGVTEACCAHYSDYLWKQIPDFSKNPTQPSNYPHIACRQNTDGHRMVTVWTEGTGPLYSLIARDTAGQVTPQFAAVLGGEEPSLYTIERDGYLTFDNGISVDYDSTELQYYLPSLDDDQETEIELVFYQPGSKGQIQNKVYVNDIPLGTVNIPAGEVYTFSKKIPPAALKEGDGILRIENKKGAYATCARWQLFTYDKATGRGGGISKGGGQAESNGERPMVYRYELMQNVPNPCKGMTVIKYQIAETGNVSLKVYNTLGQVVRTIVDHYQQPGFYRVGWDGRDAAGRCVSAGVYFYRLKVGGFDNTKRLLMIK